jgi:hypothetical protein
MFSSYSSFKKCETYVNVLVNNKYALDAGSKELLHLEFDPEESDLSSGFLERDRVK